MRAAPFGTIGEHHAHHGLTVVSELDVDVQFGDKLLAIGRASIGSWECSQASRSPSTSSPSSRNRRGRSACRRGSCRTRAAPPSSADSTERSGCVATIGPGGRRRATAMFSLGSGGGGGVRSTTRGLRQIDRAGPLAGAAARVQRVDREVDGPRRGQASTGRWGRTGGSIRSYRCASARPSASCRRTRAGFRRRRRPPPDRRARTASLATPPAPSPALRSRCAPWRSTP